MKLFTVNNIAAIVVGIAGWNSKTTCGDSQYVYLLYCWGLHCKQRLGPNELRWITRNFFTKMIILMHVTLFGPPCIKWWKNHQFYSLFTMFSGETHPGTLQDYSFSSQEHWGCPPSADWQRCCSAHPCTRHLTFWLLRFSFIWPPGK